MRVFDREVAQMFVALIKSGDKAWWVQHAASYPHPLTLCGRPPPPQILEQEEDESYCFTKVKKTTTEK